MAYNKYDSDKQVSYMAGIPVKISEQYKPPKKIILPGAVTNKLSMETELPDYDFSLERSIKDKMSQWRQLRQIHRQERRECIEAEKQARAARETTTAAEEKPSGPERALSPTTATSEPYPILTPVPINASTSSQSTTYSYPHLRAFNISEFEQDTASPFDNMELKTINDLEELAHVLQPTVISDKNKTDVRSPAAVEEKTIPPRLNGFNTQYSYNNLNWSSNLNPNLVNDSNSMWFRGQNTVPSLPQIPPTNPHPPMQSYVVQRVDLGAQNSKSVPDIVQQLEMELKGKREAENRKKIEQPQRPASIGPAEVSRKPTLPTLVSLLPNPYNQLSAQCQQLTDRLAEMGFPLPRVARAAQRFGDDETRIVEFLVQVQRLEEKNYLADRVEKALIANDYKDADTVTYLNTLGQLLDLGFSEDKVEEALTKCGADRDKALDLLIS